MHLKVNSTKVKTFLLLFTFLLIHFSVSAQAKEHEQSSSYVPPTDPLVIEKLDKWKDLKFGMIIHWGLYTSANIVESWPLVSEEEDWIRRNPNMTYEEFKKWYWDLAYLFKPHKFNPEQWAKAAKTAGMKYLVFTTKHHDGFCLFDTKETDYSIMNYAFKDNPKANLTKYVFEAFRNEGLMIGAYYSKPDWHSQYYWWDKYATYDRNNNYDIRKNPERWEKFKDYCYNQINELTTNYGQVDILWLDGGQVRPITPKSEAWFGKSFRGSQDIDMPRIAAMARKNQPGLIMVDRTVVGPYENYQTPEHTIPDEQLSDPWESCLTLGDHWGYMGQDKLKTANWAIGKLAEIVAKGGSLLLGVGPTDEGIFVDEAVSRLNDIGKWMDKNGEAIYNTRITKNYHDGSTWFTESKDGKTIYAIHCIEENAAAPSTITWKGNIPAKGAKIKLLENGANLSYKVSGDAVTVTIPKNLRKDLPAVALAFAVDK